MEQTVSLPREVVILANNPEQFPLSTRGETGRKLVISLYVQAEMN